MKLLFSEAAPDHAHYVYPYAVWAFLEAGETPADALAAGFLPGAADLGRFYLCRQLRLPLADWKPSSENRRVLRKGANLRCELIPKARFDFSTARRERWLAYAASKWGTGVMSPPRLERLIGGAVVTHVLHFTDAATGADAGTALLYLEERRVAFYYYSFYEVTPETRHHGLAMMTRAAEFFAAAGFGHLHLGSCYSEAALYKTQFEPMEFFNGFRWSRNLDELKHLVRTPAEGRHRLETPEFLAFQEGPPAALAANSSFRSR